MLCVGQTAFAVIRESIRKEGTVALASIVFTTREHVISLETRGGERMLGVTLRYPYEVPEGSDKRELKHVTIIVVHSLHA